MWKVVLTEPQSKWRVLFLKEAEAIKLVLADVCVRCHHMGSTAIAGICAKPVIDIMLEVQAHCALDERNERLEALGYVGLGEFGIEGRRYFYKGIESRTHHIHAFEVGHPEVVRHLRFRDYMNAFPEKAKAYEALKLKLVKAFPTDPEGYTDGKSEFISQMDREAAEYFASDVRGDAG
jgi:GrpB-like predicted nucleotidyltransferase (UPF0157 family)